MYTHTNTHTHIALTHKDYSDALGLVAARVQGVEGRVRGGDSGRFARPLCDYFESSDC